MGLVRSIDRSNGGRITVRPSDQLEHGLLRATRYGEQSLHGAKQQGIIGFQSLPILVMDTRLEKYRGFAFDHFDLDGVRVRCDRLDEEMYQPLHDAVTVSARARFTRLATVSEGEAPTPSQ
jgi:hypothetical protein